MYLQSARHLTNVRCLKWGVLRKPFLEGHEVNKRHQSTCHIVDSKQSLDREPLLGLLLGSLRISCINTRSILRQNICTWPLIAWCLFLRSLFLVQACHYQTFLTSVPPPFMVGLVRVHYLSKMSFIEVYDWRLYGSRSGRGLAIEFILLSDYLAVWVNWLLHSS